MKYKLTRYDRANGTTYYTVENKGWIFNWKLNCDHSFGHEPAELGSRQKALDLIDLHISNIHKAQELRAECKIVKTTVEYVVQG